jgi:hypothetical protein
MEPLKYPDLEELRRKWQSPETAVVLQAHMEQYFRYGVIAAYLACADSMYPETYGPNYAKRQAQISRLARAEVYLAATRLHKGEGDYFLERVNEETGFSVITPDPVRNSSEIGTILPVLRLGVIGMPRKVIPPFTETQAELVVQNADELQDMGLVRPLYSHDTKYFEDGL